jgi:hypothetical protein
MWRGGEFHPQSPRENRKSNVSGSILMRRFYNASINAAKIAKY